MIALTSKSTLLTTLLSISTLAAFATAQEIRIYNEIPKQPLDMRILDRLVKQGKVKEAVKMIDQYQLLYPNDFQIQKYFVIIFTCQRRDREVLDRTNEYLENNGYVPEIVQMRKVSAVTMALKSQASGNASLRPYRLVSGKPVKAQDMPIAYDVVFDGSNTDIWIKFGILDRILTEDPSHPRAICHYFGSLSNNDKISKMRSFSLKRLEDAYKRVEFHPFLKHSTALVIRDLIGIKKWMIKDPNWIPPDWK